MNLKKLEKNIKKNLQLKTEHLENIRYLKLLQNQ